MPYDFLLPLGLALLPGVVAYWTGRKLLPKQDDPELPELLIARRGRLNTVWICSLVAVIFISEGSLRWIPLLVLGLLVGSYPLRRALFRETWGLGGYVLWSLRSALASAGFLLALMFTPLLVVEAKPYHWLAAAGAGAVLTAWLLNQERLWLRIIGARPLADAGLRARFAEIAQRAGRDLPALYLIGARGGTVPNAFALPHARHPGVVFGDTLLELLEPDEATAIFAHEFAHLEQYDAQRLRRNHIRALAAIGVALAVPLVAVAMGAQNGWLAMFVGTWSVIAILWNRAARFQADETAADRRAAELVGDPEMVVRGLTRVHQYARLPRRWPAEMEGRSTHPSLSRRIAAVRGEAVPLVPAGAVVPSPRVGSWVAFDERRVSFFEGVPEGTEPEPAALHLAAASARSVAYAELADLRIRATGDAPVLAATDRAGISWTFPIFAADVDSLRTLVQQVDGQLGIVEKQPSTTPHRAFALLALVVAALAGGFGVVLLPALLAMIWPGTVSMMALGTIAVARAAFGVADGAMGWSGPTSQWAMLALALIGIGMMGVAVLRAPDRASGPYRPWRILGPLALIAALFLLQAGLATANGVDWVEGVPAAGTAGLLLLAVGAGMLRLRSKGQRRAGAAVALAGLAPLGLALGTARMGGAPDLAWSTGTADAAESIAIPEYGDLAGVAPSGRAFLLYAEDPQRGPNVPATFTLGGDGVLPRTFSALAAAFASDSTILVLAEQGGVMELRMESLSQAGHRWSRVLPPLPDPQLAADGAGGWRVWGHDRARRTATVLAGAGADGPVRTLRVNHRRAYAVTPLGDGALVFRVRDLRAGASLPWPFRASQALVVDVIRADAAGERRVATVRGFPACSAPDAAAGLVCEAVDGRRGTLWTFAPDGTARRLGRIPSDLGQLSQGGGAIAAYRWTGGAVLIDPATRRARRIALDDGDFARAVFRVRDGIAVHHRSGDGWALAIHRLSADR